MALVQHKKTKFAFLYSPLGAIFLLIVLFALSRGAYEMFNRYEKAHSKMKAAALENANLNEEKANLDKEIAELGTPAGVEKKVREKFNMVKVGEGVVVVVDDPKTPTSEEETGGSFWNFLKKIFTINE